MIQAAWGAQWCFQRLRKVCRAELRKLQNICFYCNLGIFVAHSQASVWCSIQFPDTSDSVPAIRFQISIPWPHDSFRFVYVDSIQSQAQCNPIWIFPMSWGYSKSSKSFDIIWPCYYSYGHLLVISAYNPIYRRKFRSETSDNMDSWKAEVRRVRRDKIRRKKR